MKIGAGALLIGCALLTSCQTDADVRSKPPLVSYSASKSVNDAVACLIPALGKSLSAAAPSKFRFVAQVIVPDKEYDIVPTDGVVNGHYIYTVNVKAREGGTTVSLYQGQFMLPSLTNAMKSGISACT